MPSGFQINGSDVDDLFVSRDIFSQGGIMTWGDNTYLQLGYPTGSTRTTPGYMTTQRPNWRQISVGDSACMAVKTDGTIWGWGSQGSGNIGNNFIADVYTATPAQEWFASTTWKQVVNGGSGGGGIKSDGTLWTWGSPGSNGNNTQNYNYTPAQIYGGGNNWKQIARGIYGWMAGIKTDGTLWTWGGNFYGSLGNGNVTGTSSPAQTVAGGTNWKLVSCGYNSMAAIKTDGTLWMWGDNSNGQLGDGTTISKSSPVQVATGGTNWKQVSVGDYFTVAIKTDGTLWTWGINDKGQLANGTSSSFPYISSPVQSIYNTVTWKQVSAGRQYAGGIKTDGTLWMWGYNQVSQLGDGTTTNRSSPVQILVGGVNLKWKQVSCGYVQTTAAIVENYT